MTEQTGYTKQTYIKTPDMFISYISHEEPREVRINPRTPRMVALEDFMEVFRLTTQEGYKLTLDQACINEVISASRKVEQLRNDQIPTYGINTGFGEMINRLIPKHATKDLQENLILTHATGVGPNLSFAQTQAILLVRIIHLSRGFSGITMSTLSRLYEMYNKKVFPVIPCQGSLGACLTKDSIIYTNPGVPKCITQIKPGDKVYSFNGGLWKKQIRDKNGQLNTYKYKYDAQIESNKVVRVINSGIKQTYRLQTYTREITCSDNHPFLQLKIINPGKYQKKQYSLQWTPLKDLKKGDFILTLKKYPDCISAPMDLPFIQTPTPDFMRLLGMILGDGYITKTLKKTVIALPVNNKNHSKYIEIIKSIFHKTPMITKDKIGIVIYNKKFGVALQELGFHKLALEKRVPDWIYKCPQNLREAFLEGYIDADCHIRDKEVIHPDGHSYTDKRTSFCSPNKALIKDLRVLAISCGYRVGKILCRSRIRGVWFNGHHTYNYNVPSDIYEFTIMNRGFFPYAFSGTITLNPETLNNEYFHFDKITNIILDKKQQVFDIEVENAHNFIANGIVVHNSGDLAPLAHIAAGLLAKGTFWYKSPKNGWLPAQDVFTKMGWMPLVLNDKEGLALINGTSAMLGLALLAFHKIQRLFYWALNFTCLDLAALTAMEMPFHPTGNDDPVRWFLGQHYVAKYIRDAIQDCQFIKKQSDVQEYLQSQIKDRMDVIESDEYLQSAYSLRVIPQVLGPAKDTLDFCRRQIERELNSTSDNPMIIGDTIFHGANFHGQAVGYACDMAKIPLIQIAQLADRRIARLIDSKYNNGLPDLLAFQNQGLQCGFEGLQYSSTSVVAEMKGKASPFSIQSIPSNLNNQDLVSMGMVSARSLLECVDNLETVLAVESATACQAIDIRIEQDLAKRKQYYPHDDIINKIEEELDVFTAKWTPRLLGENIYITYNQIRQVVAFHTHDFYMGNVVSKIKRMMREVLDSEIPYF